LGDWWAVIQISHVRRREGGEGEREGDWAVGAGGI